MSAGRIEARLAAATPGTGDLVIENDLAIWLTEDPLAAARFAELQADPFLREVSLRVVAQGWAHIDAQATARWAESMAGGPERDRALEYVALAIADASAQDALALLRRRGTVPTPDAAQMGIVERWARRDFAAARAWLEAQPPGEARDQVVQGLAFLRANEDPLAAIELLERSITGSEARSNAWAAIAQLWSHRDPGAVREWARSTDLHTQRRVEAELALAGDSARD